MRVLPFLTLVFSIALFGVSPATGQSAATVADEIDLLRDQINTKIEEDVSRTATAFTDARDMNKSLIWSDLFSAPLQIFKTALSGLMAIRNVSGWIKGGDVRVWIKNSLNGANTAHEALSILHGPEGLKQDGVNLAMAIDGPSYAAQTEAILEGAEQHVGWFKVDRTLYQQSIYYELFGIGSLQSPLPVIRRSGKVDRRGGSILPTILEARRTMRNELQKLSDQVRNTPMTAARAQELSSYVAALRQAVQQSRSKSHKFVYTAVLEDDAGTRNSSVSMSLGYPRSLESWRGLMLDRFVQNTSVEIKLRAFEDITYGIGLVAGETVDRVNLKLNVEAVIAGQATTNLIALETGALTMGIVGAQVTAPLDAAREFASNAREQVTYIPQQMMDALPGEVSNLFMLTDDLVRTINIETRVRPKIDLVAPRYLMGKPLPQTTRITISGENFTASSRLEFNDGVNSPYENRQPATWSATALTYDVIVGMESADWTVKVVDGGISSRPYAFYVSAPGGSKTLTGLAIEGPAIVSSGGSALYTARAHYSDGTNNLVTATWSENSSSASISSSGGLLSANTVSSNRTLTVTADYTEGGIPKTATTEVTIVTSSGSGGSQTTDVIVNGGFESGTTPWAPVGYAGVVALSYPRTGTRYAYLGDTNNATGAVSQFFPIPANMTEAAFEFYLNPTSHETTTTEKFDKMKVSLSTANDQHVADIAEFSNLDKRTAGSYIKKSYNLTSTLNAYKGQSLFLVFSATTDYADFTTFRIDDVKLNITTSAPVSLVDLVIEGDSAVPANSLEDYEALAVFSDGSTQRVSPNSWSDNSSLTTISSAGYFQTGNLTTTTTVTISTSYSFNGHTENASKTVTVFPLSTPPVFDRLAIEGPGWVDEGSYVNVAGKAIYTDGSIQTVSPTWSLASNWATINSNGRVDAEEVSGDRSITVQANHTIGGLTRTASHELLVIDNDTEPSLDSLEIIGAPSLAEGQFESYEARAHFSDGSQRYVSPAWQENSSATTISSYGLLTASQVGANTSVTLSATYATGGTQRSASLVVTVVNVPDTQGPGLSITSPLSGFLSPIKQLTVTGVASDAGFGNNGVSAVNVNGVPASGGAASNTGVADWSATIELAEGSNSILVTATDSIGNVSSSSIQVNWEAGTPVPLFAWAKSGGGAGDERLNGLEVDKQGNVFALLQYVGNFRIQGLEITGTGTLESALLMLSPDGSLRWALEIESPSVVVATSLAVAPSGHSLVAGYFGTSCRLGGFEVFSKGARDGFLAKLDPAGHVEWVRTFGSPAMASADRCFVTSCALTPDGAAVLSGYFLGSLAFGSELLAAGSFRNPFVAQYTATGSPAWISRGTGTGNIRAMALAVGPTGSIAVVGDLENGSLSWGGQSLAAGASRDAYAALLSPAGQVQWLRGIQSSAGIELTGLALDSAGALFASGYFEGSLDLQAASLQSRGGRDVFVVKLDPSGNRVWLKQLGSADLDDAYDLKLTDEGVALITGMLSGQGQFAGSNYGVAEGSEPYVAAYSPAGEELSLRSANSLTPGADLGFGTQVASDWAGNCYCGGVFTGSLSFGATTLVASENIAGVYDLFLAKLGLASLAMPELRIGGIGPQIELLWPAGWDDWVLESSPTLGPAASWQVVSTLPVLENGMLKVRPGLTGMKSFYRLRQR